MPLDVTLAILSSCVISCSTRRSTSCFSFLEDSWSLSIFTGLLNSVSQFGCFFFPLLLLALPYFSELQEEAVQQQKLFLSSFGNYLVHLKCQKRDEY